MHNKIIVYGLGRMLVGATLIGATLFSSVTRAEQRMANIYQLGEEHEALMATPNASSGSCGVERWSVKVGTDPDAGLINLNNPVIQTITYLRAQTAPTSPPLNARVQPTETTLFVLDATLIEYKLENDSDYHMVIKDAAGNTMIAEIADPACVTAGSPFANLIQNARNEFDAKYSATTSFQTANIPVQITGVAFFDFLHGQTGVAPNGIELHPVLDVVFNPGSGGANFALSASPSSVSVSQGASTTVTIAETAQNGFTGAVSLAASGLPSGVTASFNPTSISGGSSTLTLTASATAATGTATMSITGASASLTHTTTVTLTVNPAGSGGGAQTAVYSSTLKAPDCATVGTSCDSGPSLLLGRATLAGGTEPNQPNTIGSSCADGTSGTYHSDESNDRLVVATTDGSPLAAGKTVKISATVWAYSATADALDLYSAANANSPTWVFLNTITPSAAGAQTLSTTFTLPSGNLQAIRANFRYQGSASACSTGAYDDHDDLIFAVGAGGGDTTPPTVNVSESGTSGTITLSATASDNVGVSKVEFYVDGVLKATDTTSPYSSALDSTTLTNASHSLVAKAYDAAGNIGISSTLPFAISNGGGTVTELIVNGGFESGTTPWTASTGVITNSTTEAAHAGSYKAWLDGYGTATTDTVVQTVSIPSAAATATLTFWLHIDTAETSTTTAYDTLTVQLQSSTGAVLTTLATYSNLNKNTGYAQKSFDVSTYKGQTVKVYFKGVEDASQQTSFVIDDVSLKSQ